MIVYCVYWGDKYSPDYVPRLRDQVAKHLSIPHEFRCITDHEFWDVDCIEPVCDYPGWWQKVGLFKPNSFPQGPSLYLDLDVAVVGSLDPLAALAMPSKSSDWLKLHIPANWAQSGHGGCQSSVMVWHGGAHSAIWEKFDPEWAHWPPRNEPGVFWGDQEWITALRDSGEINVQHTNPEYIRSYKYHVRGKKLEPETRVVVFHGDPKPTDVREPWLENAA